MGNGDALFFQGNLWHYSKNTSENRRSALLLQYTTPDVPIRMPDINHLNWPLEKVQLPKPPCILVSGIDEFNVNRLVSPPIPDQNIQRCLYQSSLIYPLNLPLPTDPDTGWKPYHIMNGGTIGMNRLTCHISSLAKEQCPHPPHTHKEEEILILLSGEVEVVLPEIPADDHECRQSLKPGEFVYYPADFPHTIIGKSDEPANYLMFKWYNKDVNQIGDPLFFQRHTVYDALNQLSEESGFKTKVLFEGPTLNLDKLHCHVSILSPQSGYRAHVDPYDVAILVLEGKVKTMGLIAKPYDLIFYPAGDPHGMYNPGDQYAKYVVFEFHSFRKPGSFISPYYKMDLLSSSGRSLTSNSLERMTIKVENFRMR